MKTLILAGAILVAGGMVATAVVLDNCILIRAGLK
jgi:hypothetical protein